MNEPFIPADIPADTDEYVYRPVTTFRGDGTAPQVFTEYMQIWISQP